MWRIRIFFSFIKRLFEYIPIIWNDRDWDYGYTIDMLIYKTKRQLKLWEKNNSDPEKYICHVGDEEDIKWMRIVIKLLTRYQDQYYESEIYKNDGSFAHDENYVKKYPNDARRTIEFLTKNGEDVDTTNISVYMGYMRNKRALALALDIFKNKAEGWWN